MRELAAYEPIKLSAETKKDYESKMAEAYVAFQRAAAERYSFSNIKKLRDEYKSHKSAGQNILWADPAARKMMEWFCSHEQEIISAYICIAHDLCSAFAYANDSGPSYADYLQEAAVAIYDAMYQYDGSTQFSTYAHWCIKNRLSTFRRSEMSAKGFTRGILKIRAKVKELMASGMSDDRAIAQLKDEGVAIDNRTLERLRASLGLGAQTPKIEAEAPVVDTEAKAEFDEMRRAVKETKLTDMERSLIEAHLNGDESYRRIVSETVINPNTGKLWTKQRLSQIFQEACEKVRATFESKSFRRVA